MSEDNPAFHQSVVRESEETGNIAESQVIPLREVERREIEKALSLYGKSTQGKKLAAQSLGISLATLYRKLEDFLN